MALQCEICGNTEIVKEDGMFVCTNCGTKYSLEEAKKLLGQGGETVSVAAPAAGGMSNEMKNLYDLARRAKNDGNDENAQKFYEMLLVKDPSAWEPNFYSTYFQVKQCKIGEIGSAAVKLNNVEKTTLELLRDSADDMETKKKNVNEITKNIISICNMLFYAYKNHYDNIGYQIRSNYNQEMLNNCGAAMLALYNLGDEIEKVLGGELYSACACAAWKAGIEQHMVLMSYSFASKNDMKAYILGVVAKIMKYEPNYTGPDFSSVPASTGGCYVATAVYGSYDCPEVWTLRRYRDNTLAQTRRGRMFIRTYYTFSPTIVKLFGKTKWFNKIFKKKLDKMVADLNSQGVEDTPYEDKDWN